MRATLQPDRPGRSRRFWPDLPAVARQVGAAAEEAVMLARLGRDLPGFLRTPLSLEEAQARVRRRLADRERSFLGLIERAVYGHPRSPYLALLRQAGCGLGDVQALVRHEGIEGALGVLARAGVYVTFDELKGRRPTIRGSARFEFTDRDFDSPLVTAHYVGFTGGTRGRPGRVPRPLAFVEEVSTTIGASLAAHGIPNDAETAYWLTNPITTMLLFMKLGLPAVLWAHPLEFFPPRARLGAACFRLLGALGGSPFPRQRLVTPQQAGRLARWLSWRGRSGRPIVVNTIPSSAVRIATAALEAGLSLEGVTFYLQSEPVTPARHRAMLASGARAITIYTSMELSATAISCATPTGPDDLHLFADRFALVERTRPVVEGGPEIDAMLFTTLSPAAPTIALNAELGDYARVEQRECGCALGGLGLTTHLSDVRSFEKLSGEGVTFVRTNLLHVLEAVLPARFGGSSLDYQLVEEEAPDSATRLVLRVSPTLGALDEAALRTALLDELGRGGIVDRHHAELLRQAGSVSVVRAPFLATRAGKVLPFHLPRRTAGPPSPTAAQRGPGGGSGG